MSEIIKLAIFCIIAGIVVIIGSWRGRYELVGAFLAPLGITGGVASLLVGLVLLFSELAGLNG